MTRMMIMLNNSYTVMIARVEKKPVDEASESSLPVCSSFGLTSGEVANAMKL